jgi:branched-chain amino acid transport system ATP-binding protein
MILECRDIVASYGPRRVLHGCDLAVDRGEIVALFGHNAAGKTSLLRVIAGLMPPDRGSVRFGGRDVKPLSAAQRARAGLAFVPDGAKGVFSTLTVAENIAMASLTGARRANGSADAVFDVFPVLRDKRRHKVSQLSGGQRQMVALAIAMARRPQLMLFDEPSIGLAPRVVEEVMQAIKAVASVAGAAVVVVEQNIPAALAVADRVQIVKQGSIVLSEPASRLPSAEALWDYF